MITPEYLARITENMRVQKELEESILKDIACRLVKTNIITETASYQAERLQDAGLMYGDIVKRTAEYSEKSENEIAQLFEDAGMEVFQYPSPTLQANGINPAAFRAMSPAMKKIWDAALSKTTTEAVNLTKTTAVTSQSLYIQACDLAHMQVASGAFDYVTAVKNAIKSAAKQGVTVIYPTGRISSLDAAVRRAVLTGINQTAGRLQQMRADEMNVDLMELSAHAGARPEHAAWQGRIVSLSGRRGYLTTSDIGYGDVRGFQGANCRHTWRMFFEGDVPTYTEQDLQDMQNQTVTYQGKEIPEYEASKTQRGMERTIRKTKQELVMLNTAAKETTDATVLAGLKQEFSAVSVRLKKQEAKLKDFCEQTGRHADSARVWSPGFDRSVSGKAVAANKKELEKYTKLLYNKDGTIVVTDDWKNRKHPHIEKQYRPFAVIETKEVKGSHEQINRTIYDANGMMEKQIHSSHHGVPEKHPYGEYGEHAHDYIWDNNKNRKDRTDRNLTKQERKEHGDIL